MADSRLSVTIRDTRHPCAPYQVSSNDFRVQIYNCDGKPLFWKGVHYAFPGVWLKDKGHGGGLIHGQFAVPPGCYLVRAAGRCTNVMTDWAWVKVGCAETVCVDLVLPSVFHCILRVLDGIRLGTVEGDQPVAERASGEVEELGGRLAELADRLREETNLPDPPSPEELEKALEDRQRS